ncbi:MAG: hypothetical protein JXA91_02585 [Candidatus Thermoplasmatota archaeon]|nr:hypothetical protein [Candidatus Thermoplasmatota archaeon]
MYFYETTKPIRGINGSVSYIPNYKCKLNHRISESTDGWVPSCCGYVCKDFVRK